MSLYSKRGVSAQKEEIHQAIKHLDQGLYPNAFCKLYPDYLGKDQEIAWRSNRPAKLKLILSGESAELNIDALRLNGRLIANPSFQMRP